MLDLIKHFQLSQASGVLATNKLQEQLFINPLMKRMNI